MADGGGNGAPIETGTTVIESPQQAVTPKKPRKRKKLVSSDGQSNNAVSGGTATSSDGDSKEKQEANKKERIVWTPKLHGKFVKACNELGLEDAVPMKILQKMKATGLTRAQIASHLQKYRESLSKRKDETISESNLIALHHKPPSPQSPLETPDMRSQPQLGHVQPPNGHISNHAVAEDLLYQELHLLLLAPAPAVQQCHAPPLNQIDPVARREIIMEEQPAAMMQQHAGAASQHSPMPAGAPVPASGEQNHRLEPQVLPSQAVNMLGGECSVPEAYMMRLREESETRMAQLQVSPPAVSIIEQYWRIDCLPSWDLFGRQHGCSDFHT